MRDEFAEFRPPPPSPYVPSGNLLIVPRNVIVETRNLICKAGALEACVFWYGLREGSFATVKAVRAPRQTATRFNYHVDEVAMSHMSQTLEDAWRPLAQVHSHPGQNVEHSRYDDEMVASKRALSLVFPSYGHISGAWPCGIGVHEWQGNYWHLLTPQQAMDRVRLAGDAEVSVEDLR